MKPMTRDARPVAPTALAPDVTGRDRVATGAADGTPARGTRTTRVGASPAGEGRVLAALAEIDSCLRERESAWKTLAGRLDTTRRELAVVTGRLERTRSLAAQRLPGEDDDSAARKRPALVRSEEARHARLLREFEASLEETEARRVALHDETRQLRFRRQEILQQLSAPVRSAYEAAVQAGRVPAITTAPDGACSDCSSRLPAPVVEAVVRGAVVVCRGCQRLLRPIEVG